VLVSFVIHQSLSLAVSGSQIDRIQKIHRKDNMLHYMDDILAWSNSFDEMTGKVSVVLSALSECGLTLNIDKCEFYNETLLS